MNAARSQAIKIGILTSVALGLLMAAVLVIGKGQNFWERKVSYEIHFARTNGLKVGAPVALTGVSIGSISAIDFPSRAETRHIVVKIDIARSLANRIRQDSVASIHTQGMLGDKYVELSAGTLAAPPRTPGTVIPAIDPVDYEAVLGQSGDIVANIVELTASLRNVLKAIDRGEGLIGAIVRNRKEGELTFSAIRETIDNLNQITSRVENIIASVERGEGILGTLVHDTDRAEGMLTRLTRAAENLDEFTERLNTSRGLLPRLIEDDELGQRILTDMQTATADLAVVTEKVRAGKGTLGALVNDPTLYNEATEFVRSTRKSWMLGIFRAIRGLWPFEGKSEEPEPGGEDAAETNTGGRPAGGSASAQE